MPCSWQLQQGLQLPDLEALSLGPEVVLVVLVEFHRLLMVLGDLDTELAFNRGTVGVQFHVHQGQNCESSVWVVRFVSGLI